MISKTSFTPVACIVEITISHTSFHKIFPRFVTFETGKIYLYFYEDKVQRRTKVFKTEASEFL